MFDGYIYENINLCFNILDFQETLNVNMIALISEIHVLNYYV